MKKVILSNGDLEVSIVKADVFHNSANDDVNYIAFENFVNDGSNKSVTIVPDYLLEDYLSKFVISSLDD